MDKEWKKKEHKLMKEEEMFKQVLEYKGVPYVSKVEEIALRKIIRKDIKQVIKLERMASYTGESTESQDSNDDDWERKIEDKVQYGSDSDRDIDEYVLSKDTPYYDNEDDEDEEETSEYGEEGEYEMEEGESEMEENDSDVLEFDKGSGSKISAKQSLKKSIVGEADELNDSVNDTDDSFAESTPMNRSNTEDRGIFEMVDLKASNMTAEFKVPG